MNPNLVLFTICIFFSTHVYSQKEYSVDIPNSSSIYVPQTQTYWCWAACNTMLLKAKNIKVTQEDQVMKLFGRLVNQGAGPNYENAKLALDGTYSTYSGGSIIVRSYVSYLQSRNPSDPIIIINHLKNGIPLVMATTAHGRVCVGVDYITNGQQYQITKMRLLNPANGGDIEEFTMAQFLQQGLIGFMTYDTQ